MLVVVLPVWRETSLFYRDIAESSLTPKSLEFYIDATWRLFVTGETISPTSWPTERLETAALDNLFPRSCVICDCSSAALAWSKASCAASSLSRFASSCSLFFLARAVRLVTFETLLISRAFFS